MGESQRTAIEMARRSVAEDGQADSHRGRSADSQVDFLPYPGRAAFTKSAVDIHLEYLDSIRRLPGEYFTENVHFV
jgi:hypothetical protein